MSDDDLFDEDAWADEHLDAEEAAGRLTGDLASETAADEEPEHDLSDGDDLRRSLAQELGMQVGPSDDVDGLDDLIKLRSEGEEGLQPTDREVRQEAELRQFNHLMREMRAERLQRAQRAAQGLAGEQSQAPEAEPNPFDESVMDDASFQRLLAAREAGYDHLPASTMSEADLAAAFRSFQPQAAPAQEPDGDGADVVRRMGVPSEPGPESGGLDAFSRAMGVKE